MRTTPSALGRRSSPRTSIVESGAPLAESPLIDPFYGSGIEEEPAVFSEESVRCGTLVEVPSDLLLHFDNGEGSSTFTDDSPGYIGAGGHTVTPTGGVVQRTAAAVFGASGVEFDGVDDRLDIADNAAWDVWQGTGENNDRLRSGKYAPSMLELALGSGEKLGRLKGIFRGPFGYGNVAVEASGGEKGYFVGGRDRGTVPYDRLFLKY